jgi:CIC family chloride channel protein
MGAVFAGAARAPITAVLIIFELTGEYRIILPLMFAIVVAAGISNLISKDTIYTLKLRRRGIDIMRGRSANLMEIVTVGEAMEPIPESLPSDLPMAEIVERFARGRHGALPVTDGQGEFRGVVTTRQIEEALRDNALDMQAADLAVEMPTLRPEESLHDALRELVRHGGAGLPVAADDGRSIVGWITHSDVLGAYTERLERSVARAESGGSLPPARLPSTGNGSDPQPERLERYRVVDLELSNDQPPAGRRVDEVAWPASSMLLAVRRSGRVLDPAGRLELLRGDRLSLLVTAAEADDIQDVVVNLTKDRAADQAG